MKTLCSGPLDYFSVMVFVYGDYLYNLRGNGSLSCYEEKTGKIEYKETLAPKAFTASGIASDGKLYFSAESGEVYVVKAGPEYELLAQNDMDDIIMATPALAEGMVIFRTQDFVIFLFEMDFSA